MEEYELKQKGTKMEINDVIDIDGKLYKIVYKGINDNFEAKPIGEVTKCFCRCKAANC